MKRQDSIVYLIDDDQSAREGLADLLSSVGHNVQSFDSAQEFLATTPPDAPCCIILDIRLPGPSGLEVQRILTNSGIHLPIIFVTAHGDISMSVRAIKAGAIEFLTKPVHEQQLLDAVQAGLERDRGRREEVEKLAELRQRFASLTPREREIFALIVSGRRNKYIAAEVGLSEMTVKVHRSHVMHKMRAKSLIDLVRISDRLGSPPAGPSKPKD